MTLQGVVQNGVVVLEPGALVPEGAVVSVVVAPHTLTPPKRDKMTEEERRRLLAIVDRIASLPNENPGDTFSGADHDKVVYGEP
jgi:hypothetical protein